MDDDALRVDAAHHVADRAVLAARVERLQNDQEAEGVLGGQTRLEVVEQLDSLLQQLLAALLRDDIARVAGIEVAGEDDVRAGRHTKGRYEVSDPLQALVFD